MPPAIASSSPRSTRIRENQRRSRQRKREYVNLLESRLSRCRSEGVSASHQVQQAALRVKRENDALRALLTSFGATEGVIERAIARQGGEQEEEAAAQGIEFDEEEDAVVGIGAGCGGYDSLRSPGSEPSGTSGSCCGPDDPTATSATTSYPPRRSARGCPPFGTTSLFSTTEKASPCSSISCEDAHRLIKRLLLRNGGEAACTRDMAEIAAMLYPGFREADVEEEGCRVKDDVLCNVLEMLNSKRQDSGVSSADTKSPTAGFSQSAVQPAARPTTASPPIEFLDDQYAAAGGLLSLDAFALGVTSPVMADGMTPTAMDIPTTMGMMGMGMEIPSLAMDFQSPGVNSYMPHQQQQQQQYQRQDPRLTNPYVSNM